MIIAAALDPASLSIWLDGSLFNRGPKGPLNLTMLDFAIRNSFAGMREILNLPLLEYYSNKLVELSSSVWHEKRHFLDLVITNYGSTRFRNYWSSYANVSSIICEAARDGFIYFPLSTYTNKIKARKFNINPSHERNAILTTSNQLSFYEKLAVADRKLRSLGGSDNIQIGGDAQLEAIAFLCQYASIRRHLGSRYANNFIQTALESESTRNLYLWWLDIFAALGHSHSPFEIKNEGHVDKCNYNIVLSILFASLATSPLPESANIDQNEIFSCFPHHRLYLIIGKIIEKGLVLDFIEARQAWSLVNEICIEIWGRSVEDEIKLDIAYQEKVYRKISKCEDNTVISITRDYIDLKKSLLEKLIISPELFISAEDFAETTLPTLRPIIIQTNPFGFMPYSGKHFISIFNYDEVFSLKPIKRYIKSVKRIIFGRNDNLCWSWAVASTKESHQFKSEEYIQLQEYDNWLSVVREYAPLMKLFMKGRNHRISLGPELVSVEARLRLLGIEPKFDPQFEYPTELFRDGSALTSISGEKKYVCDLCREYMSFSNATIASPWTLRGNHVLNTVIFKSRGGNAQARVSMLQDWSPHVLCPYCAKAWETLTDKYFGEVIFEYTRDAHDTIRTALLPIVERAKIMAKDKAKRGKKLGVILNEQTLQAALASQLDD